MSLWHSPAATTCTLTSVGPGARTSRSSRISAFSPSKTSPSMSLLQSVWAIDAPRGGTIAQTQSLSPTPEWSPRPQNGLHLGVGMEAEDATVPADAAQLPAAERGLVVALRGVDPDVAGLELLA